MSEIIDLTKGTSTDREEELKVCIPLKKRPVATKGSITVPNVSPNECAPDLRPEPSQPAPPDFAISELLFCRAESEPPILEPQVFPLSSEIPSTSAAAMGQGTTFESSLHFPKQRVRLSHNLNLEKTQSNVHRNRENLTEISNRVKARLSEEKVRPSQKPGTKLLNQMRQTSNSSSVPVKKRRQSSGSGSFTSEKLQMLERIYAVKSKSRPTVTEWLEICEVSGITDLQKLKTWWRHQNQVHQPQQNNVRNDGQYASGSGNNTNLNSHVTGSNDDGIPRQKLRFLKKPEDRTMDLDVVRADIAKVKNCEIGVFKDILESSWNIKARRIYELASTKDRAYKAFKDTLFRESKRLKEINEDVSPLSEKQSIEVSLWESRFIERYQFNNKETIKNIVLPWLAPFVYGRITAQDDRLLTLEVALYDFSKVSDRATDLKWETPLQLQYDYCNTTF